MEHGFEDALLETEDDDGNMIKNSYYSNWRLDLYANGSRTIQGIYYAFTTLTTVGFGDFYPISNLERLIMIVIFIIGVAIFSLILGQFLDTITGLKKILAKYEEADRLSKFMNLLTKYNKGVLKTEFKEKIEDHFEY